MFDHHLAMLDHHCIKPGSDSLSTMAEYIIAENHDHENFIFAIMNLRELILKEHSKAHTLRVIQWIGYDKKKVAELMKLFLGNEYRVTQRAAWVVSHLAEQYPDLMKKYLVSMIDNLERTGLHDAVSRNTLKVLETAEIHKHSEGRLLEICFRKLESAEEPVAVKVYAMEIIGKLSKSYPEIREELRLMIEEQLPFATPAFKSRAKKIINVEL